MALRLGINGFGRVGRLALRVIREQYPDSIEVVAVNDLADATTNAHLFKYDSSYGAFRGTVEVQEGQIVVDGHQIAVFSEREPSAIPWDKAGAEVVIESTGRFTAADRAKGHLERGARRVVISAPGKGDVLTVNMGVNHELYDPDKHTIVSNGSCTTNCLSVTAKVLSREFGIRRGFVTTVHSYTNTQRILDLVGDDLRESRAAGLNIIPASTGAAKAIFLVLPELEGKMHGMALRVPTPTVSVVDLVAELDKPVSASQVNDAYRRWADGEMRGYLGYTDEPLVSMDYKGDSRSGIVDGPLTAVLGDNMIKVMSWYDNEWGYACRLVDLVNYMAGRGL